jgi:hypothetical protein
VSIRQCRFEQFAAAAGDSGADLTTMVAVLHHLDLNHTLARIPALLAPGGRLLVVGLARVNSLVGQRPREPERAYHRVIKTRDRG